MPIPNHAAIIPDGNRRWAKKRGLPPFFGHREGAKTTETILKTALDLEIPYLTLWGCSISNVTLRSKTEVAYLFKLFEAHFKKLAKNKLVHENGVRVNVVGRWEELFPEGLKKALREVIKKTARYTDFQLTFLMAYSGVDEMTQAAAQVRSKEDIKKYLWTRDLPPVDLVIRTGGEPHWSAGFMMWDVAEARLHFTGTFWPEFSEKEFRKIIEEYGSIERRFGK